MLKYEIGWGSFRGGWGVPKSLNIVTSLSRYFSKPAALQKHASAQLLPSNRLANRQGRRAANSGDAKPLFAEAQGFQARRWPRCSHRKPVLLPFFPVQPPRWLTSRGQPGSPTGARLCRSSLRRFWPRRSSPLPQRGRSPAELRRSGICTRDSETRAGGKASRKCRCRQWKSLSCILLFYRALPSRGTPPPAVRQPGHRRRGRPAGLRAATAARSPRGERHTGPPVKAGSPYTGRKHLRPPPPR